MTRTELERIAVLEEKVDVVGQNVGGLHTKLDKLMLHFDEQVKETNSHFDVRVSALEGNEHDAAVERRTIKRLVAAGVAIALFVEPLIMTFVLRVLFPV